MPKRAFQDPELGKFTWNATLEAWEGMFEFTPGVKVGLQLGGDDFRDVPAPKHTDLPTLMPKIERFLDLLRRHEQAWRRRAEGEIWNEVFDWLDTRGYDPNADAEACDGLVLEVVDMFLTGRSSMGAIVRYSYSIYVGGSMTVDWWVEVEVNARGQYKGARLVEV